MGCFLESIYIVHIFEKKFESVKFFPVVYYMFPCIIGATIQAIFYGIATGWLSVSIAFMLVHMQFQSFNTFIDDVGLVQSKVFELLSSQDGRNRKCQVLWDYVRCE